MSRIVDPFDELAAMFLTSTDDPGSAGREGAITVELVTVGNLPVRAGLWITPYADAVARREGAVALVRLDGERPRLQLLNRPEGVLASSGQQTLQAVVEQLAADVRYWIICPPAGAGLASLVGGVVDRVTLLTSADDAAAVRAYQQVKELAALAAGQGATLPSVGVAVLGADEGRAARLVERLDRTAAACLDLEVELVAHVPRIDADIRLNGDVIFSGDRMPEPADVVPWIRRAAVEPTAPPPAPETGAPVTVSGTESGSEPAPVPPPRVAPVPTAAPAPAPAADPPPPDDLVAEIGGRGPLVSSVKLAPVPSDVEPKPPAPEREPHEAGAPVPLAKYVDGLTPLAPRCPGRERVELAADAAGRLHLLGRETELRQLHVVAAWARDHRELLAMACPAQRLQVRGETICHVFSAEPASLADLHGSDLRLHVLAPVRVGDEVAWYAAPLSR
ncbi:MAG: hypothetical protein ACYTG1_13220 [Planctomycetota bacterium]|jgi:hypothetical protein